MVMDTRERRQLRKLAKEMSETGDMEQYVLASGCIELLDYLDALLQREEPEMPQETTAAPQAAPEPAASPDPDMVPVTCWCRGEQLWQRR
jgi:hypothetical protein